MLVNMKLYVPRGILFSMPNHRACSMTQKSGSFTLLMTAIRDKCRGWRKHWARLYQDIIPNLNQVLNHLPSGFPGHSMNPRTQHPRIIMLIKDSLCARCQSLCFAYICLFNPHDNSVKLLFPFQIWGKWDTDRAGNLYQVTEQVSGKAGIQTQALCLQAGLSQHMLAQFIIHTIRTFYYGMSILPLCLDIILKCQLWVFFFSLTLTLLWTLWPFLSSSRHSVWDLLPQRRDNEAEW